MEVTTSFIVIMCMKNTFLQSHSGPMTLDWTEEHGASAHGRGHSSRCSPDTLAALLGHRHSLLQAPESPFTSAALNFPRLPTTIGLTNCTATVGDLPDWLLPCYVAMLCVCVYIHKCFNPHPRIFSLTRERDRPTEPETSV